MKCVATVTRAGEAGICGYEPPPAWRPPLLTDHQLMRIHSDQSGHPLCRVCERSMTSNEDITCDRCIKQAARLVRETLELFALLPDEIGMPAAQVYDREQRGGGDEQPLPGGRVLTLLSPGGTGLAPRRLTPLDRQRGLTGAEHLADNDTRDGASVSEVLARWEDDWRHTLLQHAGTNASRGVRWWLPDAVGPLRYSDMIDLTTHVRSGQTRSVLASARYLGSRIHWAAREHPAFGAFLIEMRKLHRQLEQATKRDTQPIQAPAPCIECGGTLERTYRKPDRCEHTHPGWLIPRDDNGRAMQTPAERAALLDLWESEHARCDQGGLVEKWRCSTCDTEFEQERYFLSVAEKLDTARRTRQREQEAAREASA